MKTYGPKRITVNGQEKNVMPLSESSVNKMLDHGKTGMIMVSACKSEIDDTNPELSLRPAFDKYVESQGGYESIDSDALYDEEQNWLTKRNKAADEELEKDIKDAGFSYSKTYGEYKGEYEPSYAVYCYNRDGGLVKFDYLRQFGLGMCKKYKQESILVQGPGDPPEYLDGNGNHVDIPLTGGVKINRENEPFKTHPDRKKTGPSITLTEQHAFKEYIFENMYIPLRPASYNEKFRRIKSGEYIL